MLLADAIDIAEEFMDGKLYTSEFTLLRRPICASPGSVHDYEADAASCLGGLSPSSVESWPLEILIENLRPDRQHPLFEVGFSPGFGPAVPHLDPAKRAELALSSEVYEPLGHCSHAVDPVPLLFQVGPVGVSRVTEHPGAFCLQRRRHPEHLWVGDREQIRPESKHLHAVLEQLLGYMELGDLAFGVMSNYSCHMFVTRVAPTTLQMLIQVGPESPHFQALLADPSASRLTHKLWISSLFSDDGIHPTPSRPLDSVSAPLTRGSLCAALRSSGKMLFRAEEIKFHDPLGTRIGSATLLNALCAVKWVDRYKQKHLLQSTRQEAELYRHMHHLQGEYVATVVAIGSWVTASFFFIATLLCEQPQKPRCWTREQCSQV
ncbi:hypothetical protein WJX73_008444 [Symbiochloris irregularis]|uniref:Uncharacterized protein n=1 Tax=Symbiochloris irregularis TaxID=706552 RepID=A0AAW1NYR0_9CHLO